MRNPVLQCIAAAIIAIQPALAATGIRFDDALAARLPALRASVPAITAAAKAASARMDANPTASLKVPREECAGLNEELIARAGGLTQVGSRRNTPEDIQLFAVRDWESFGPRAAWMVRKWRDEGNMVIVFGSEAGRPKDLEADFFIDNGAPDGSSGHASANAAANVALAWMWCCEYAAAFSRSGFFPAVTKGIVSPTSWGHNEGTEAPDGGLRLYKCDTPVAEGDLAVAYLNRFAKLLADIREPQVAKAIASSAEIIADRLAAGRRVAVAGLGHMILEEPKHGLKSPMIGFRAVSMLPDSFRYAVEDGDLIVWITYSGMNSAWDDYGQAIRRSGADLIVSYAGPPPPPESGILEFIPQPWAPPDAEVAIPVPPYAMAPVSAIARILVLRLLDEEVAATLKSRGLEIRRPEIARPDEFHDYGQRRFSHLSAARWIPDPGDRWGLLDSNGCVVVEAEFPKQLNVKPNGQARGHADGTNVVIDLATGAVARKPAPPAKPRIARTQRPAVRMGWGMAVRPFCTNGMWGAAARDGSIRIEPRYDNIRWVGDDLFIVQSGERYGLAGGDGREILPPCYDMISPRQGFLVVGTNLTYGILSPDGSRLLTAPRYGAIPSDAGNGLVRGKLSGKTGLFTLDGREVLPATNEAVRAVLPDCAIVRNGGRWGIVRLGDGAPVSAKTYSRIEEAPAGGFVVEEGRHFGLLAADGTEVAPVAFEMVSQCRHAARGERIVRRGREMLILRDDGSTRPFPFDCDYADFFEEGAMEFPGGGLPRPSAGTALYRVAKDGKWGVVGEGGNVVLPLEYTYVAPADAEGRALVAKGGTWRLDAAVKPILHGAKWGVCDKAGRILIQPLFDAIGESNGYWNFVRRRRHVTMTP